MKWLNDGTFPIAAVGQGIKSANIYSVDEDGTLMIQGVDWKRCKKLIGIDGRPGRGHVAPLKDANLAVAVANRIQE